MSNEKDAVRWPIRPDHITNDAGLAGTGIITTYLLQAFQSEICDSISFHPPTTILEFDKDGKQDHRTDSPLLKYAINPACKHFRGLELTCAHVLVLEHDTQGNSKEGPCCRLCDRCYAHIVHGMHKDGLTISDILSRQSQDVCFNGIEAIVRDSLLEPIIHDGRLVLQYNCPFL